MNVSQHLCLEFDETLRRLDHQVLALVPLDQQQDRLPGANSVTWITFHIARHAALALSIVTGTAGHPNDRLSAFEQAASSGGAGLQEVQQPFAAALDPATVNDYARRVFADVRTYLGTVTEDTLDELPDVEAALAAAGVDVTEFDWLYRMWADQTVSFLVRWPLIGHVTHHVGELTGMRNQMGLSPFR